MLRSVYRRLISIWSQLRFVKNVREIFKNIRLKASVTWSALILILYRLRPFLYTSFLAWNVIRLSMKVSFLMWLQILNTGRFNSNLEWSSSNFKHWILYVDPWRSFQKMSFLFWKVTIVSCLTLEEIFFPIEKWDWSLTHCSHQVYD